MTPDLDPKTRAFCLDSRHDLFHPITHRHEIHRTDPYDLVSIHQDARRGFQKLMHHARNSRDGGSSGRILLMRGESGAGKTHLLRAFRSWSHQGEHGYCCYSQLSTSTYYYPRYLLNNLIDALNQPYNPEVSSETGLMRLSNALVDAVPLLIAEDLRILREGDGDPETLCEKMELILSQLVDDDRFEEFDSDFLAVMLYLQCREKLTKKRVLKYLRCEELTEPDRKALRGVNQRVYADAPKRMIQLLGQLMMLTSSSALVFFLDQLEDIFHLDDADNRFRRVLSNLQEIVDALPSIVVVIACLSDYYQSVRPKLSRSIVDRLELDPRPLDLQPSRSFEEIRDMIARRLHVLYAGQGVDHNPTGPDAAFPFPEEFLRSLVGQRTRDILNQCHEYRERCQIAGNLVPWNGASTDNTKPSLSVKITKSEPDPRQKWEEAWTDLINTGGAWLDVPDTDEEQAFLLAKGLRLAMRELLPEDPRQITHKDNDVTFIRPGVAEESYLIRICNDKRFLGRRIAELTEAATVTHLNPILLRDAPFPIYQTGMFVENYQRFQEHGGAGLVVEDTDWRAILAMELFREKHEYHPHFETWLQSERPIARLNIMTAIMQPRSWRTPAPVAEAEAEVKAESEVGESSAT